jgi:DNA invertase Pin-like site-specific DNA recombinase
MIETARQAAGNAPFSIGGYYRISQEDGRDESYSIVNQRAMIRSYIAENTEFSGAKITEYIDDGVSGSRTDRDAYQRLLKDVRRGAVDCIIVKDLSRIGRNMLEVDDLLMNYLVMWGVRFVSINDGYDSLTHPLSNLELAVINLANQHYNRDLAVKSISAKLVKMKRGEYLSMPPFGYMKSDTEKNKLVIDEEAAGYVRLIFSLACEGRRTMEIAQLLNAQGVPSPSVYKIAHGHKNIWPQRLDPDYCFWASGVVRKLIMNEAYLGKAVSCKFRVTEPGTGRTTPRPREEWIIVPDAHEAIVCEADFRKAQAILPKQKYYSNPEHVFGSKVKCPTCGYAMKRYTRNNPRFKCGTAKLTDHYSCREYTVLQSDIEKTVLASVRAYAAAALSREEIKLAFIEQSSMTATELGAKIRTEEAAIVTLESSVAKIFTQLAAEKISTDAFLQKKSVINGAIERKRTDTLRLREQLHVLTEGRAAAEDAIAELTPLLTVETLDRELVDILIDRILVHGEKEIEIVWKDKSKN